MNKDNNTSKITVIKDKIITQDKLYDIMLNALILKYGLNLTSAQVAQLLGISTRTLDERRKSGYDCPKYLDRKGRLIHYPAHEVVEYQIIKSKNCIETLIHS